MLLLMVLRAIQDRLYRGACSMWVYVIVRQWGKSETTVFVVCWALATLALLLLADTCEVYQELCSLTTLTQMLLLATLRCSIHSHVSLGFVLGARPGTFPVEPFSRMEVFNIDRSSSLNSPPQNDLPETDCTLTQPFTVYLREVLIAHLATLRARLYRAIQDRLYRLNSR